MKPIARASSERRLISESLNVSPDIKKLTIKAKDLYRPFNVIELQMSRLYALKGFQKLIQ